MEANLDLENPIINETFLSLTELLWSFFQEGWEGLDTMIDSLIHQLLREGPKAFEDVKHFFPDDAKKQLLENKAYNNYLNTYLRVKGQNNGNQNPNFSNTAEFRDSKPAKDEVRAAESEYAKPQQNNNQEYKPEVDQVRNLIQERIEQNFPEAIQKIDDSQVIDDSTLEGAFKRLKREVKNDYDQNFTLIYGLGEQKQPKKDIIITNIVNQHKDKEFTTLFNALRPFLFDLLKRREGFEEFVQILRKVATKEKISCQKVIKTLEVKDVIVLLLESCSKKSMAKLGPWFTNQFYPLPIFYPIGKNSYKVNLDCCLELMFQTRKMLITSLGTKNGVKIGKSSLLSYLFSTKNPAFFSTANGFTHPGSVDLYAKLPQDNFQYIVADINGYVEDKEFKNLTSKLLAFSHLTIVQLTDTDLHEDPSTGEVNMAPFVDSLFTTKNNFIFLFRDYDEDAHSNVIDQIKASLEKYSNFHGVIPVPKLDSQQSFDIQNDKLQVLEDINSVLLEKLNQCAPWPIADLEKSYQFNVMPGVNVENDMDKESKMIKKLLDDKYKQSQKLYETLFPCFWIDFLLNEELQKKRKMDINHAELAEVQVLELSKKYDEITKMVKSYQVSKSKIQPSELIEKICRILSSNEIDRTLLLSETINDWKMPIFDPIKKKYLELCADKKDVQEDQKKILDQEIKRLENEMDDKDITLDTFLDEIHSLYESGKVNDALGIEGIKDYIYANMKQGAPINLVNGKTLKFGSKLLKELFENYDARENKRVYIVSIIGAQSSAKSTLLNVLFGCGFVTSAGRCTKGLYISLLEHPDGSHLIVIDTEGLLSVVARDHEFDNLITTMAFSCSHLVIINNKGEINTKLRELLEICVYAMKHLKIASIKPKIIFALRDIADDNPKIQQEMLIHMKSSLEQAAKKLLININDFINISEEDVFLLPSAFQLSRGENGSKVQSNNNLFSQKVLDMRNYIFKYLETNSNANAHQIMSPRWFYSQTEQLWGDITEHGKDIMRARSFLEIELKEKALEGVNIIYKKFDEIFFKKGRSLIEHQKIQLKNRSIGVQDDFNHLLTTEFNKMKNEAIAELDREVCDNEKYAAISGSHREFRETLEYYLGWQRQNFISEWRSSLISYETIKSMTDFKTKLKIQVDEILKNKSNVGTLTNNILALFEQIKKKSTEDFTKRLETLQKDNINKLAPEIQGHFECAQQKRARKDGERIIIPSVGELVDRMRYNNIRYDEEKWVKLGKLSEIMGSSKSVHAAVIAKEFRSLQNELNSVINEVSTEDNASNIIAMCVDRFKKMETNRIPVNFAAFMPCCLLEAMYAQFNKTKEAEIVRMSKMQSELEEVLVEEERHINELLDQSQSSYNRGETTAKKCYREIQRVFCDEQETVLHDAVMAKIREEFPAPESANIKAYSNSFEISNYENVVKYVLNINKYIRELYDDRIKTIAEFEIERKLNKLKNDFVGVIHQTISVANKWYSENETQERVDLSTLFACAQENEQLRNYFPEMYIVQISDIKAFVRGFETSLSSQLTNFDTKKELKEFIYKKVEEYLNNQYQTLVGCQSRCPICHNKCTRPDPSHTDHHTNCHLLSSFSGVHDRNTKEATLCRCFDPYNYKCTWFSGEVKYNDFDEFIGTKYPEWRQEFPTKNQPEKHETTIPPKIIECWVATKPVLIAHYKYKDCTPPEWEAQVPKDKRLKENLILKGYNDAQDSK